MIYVCLWSPRWATGGAPLAELATTLLEVAPRVAVDGRGVVWADARGLPAREIARELVERAGGAAGDVRAGVSAVPVAAELAARGSGGHVTGGGTAPPVIPAKAGIQTSENEPTREDPSFPRKRESRSQRGTSWIPAFAGMTDGTAGMTDGTAGMTDGPAGMTDGPAGMTEDSSPARITLIPPGEERSYIAPLPLDLLAPEPRLLALLDGVGVRTCGDLAALSREAVEVRFGAEAGTLWRLSRADDRRILFRPIPPERPQASMDFVEYEVREAGRLVFTTNALLGSVCGTLETRGERARSMTLVLGLSGGGEKRERLRSSRPTSDRAFWIRRLQGVLDRLRLPEPVVGVSLEVDETEPRSATQGDLFDRGFATAGAVEDAVARLLDEQGPVVVAPEMDAHPLAERRTRWIVRTAEEVAGQAGGSGRSGSSRRSPRSGHSRAPRPMGRSAAVPHPAARSTSPEPATAGVAARPDIAPEPEIASPDSAAAPTPPDLALQLLKEPRPLTVRIAFRGVQILPEAYRYAGGWHGVAVAAGPDRLSGGRWEDAPFARDYFHCVTEEGRLVWIYRDLDENRWYLHGWWA